MNKVLPAKTHCSLEIAKIGNRVIAKIEKRLAKQNFGNYGDFGNFGNLNAAASLAAKSGARAGWSFVRPEQARAGPWVL